MKKKSRIEKAFVYILLIFVSLLFLAPLFWMVTTSLKGPEELYQFPPKWIPAKFHFENFKEAWLSQPFTQFLTNSLTVTIMATLGQIVSSSLVAYGFARFQFKGRDFLFILLLATMMIPWEVTMIPLYMEFNWLGWLNTLKPLIVPAWFGAPFFIFLLRQFIMGIPKELDEAAKIDGANSFQIFYKIYLPLMKPALILVGVFSFLNCWNDYLGPLVFLNDQSKYTLTLGLAQFRGMFGVNMEGIMAITFLISIPPLIIFFAAQRYIMEDVSKSGIKG
ncbi:MULTISPECIES: carbohydrate ABC transporter permease [Bacillaceae]|uniref:carbohydrate ABC transporter permease n=1 Tax=Bacillaceae TaxID=186817 RepID=UPI002FFDCC05